MSYEEASSTLKKWREEHSRRSEDVVEIWEFVFESILCCFWVMNFWVVFGTAIAALDQARHDLAIDCIQQLHQQFPKSMRVTKLQAMRLEAIGNYEDADKLYEKLIEADETNQV
uniref:ER membrane protein complex subunit 2 n=1 Tax=Meloidogyne incognita TaxID=6306 RepID=A0A914NX45_MELIC